MSLLTEEQIEQLVKIASVTSTVKSYHDKFCEWNEKQTAQQIEIDWNDAPKNATKVALRLHWGTEDKDLGGERWYASYDSVTFERPAPVITPHPHAAIMAKYAEVAAIMAKYAEVAARRRDPWVEFEYKHKANKNWLSFLASPNFNVDYEYRYIGDNK